MVALPRPGPLRDRSTNELRPAARPRTSRHRPLSAAALALCACVLGHACGRATARRTTPLAPAGSPRDDEHGVLARLSTGSRLERGQQTARARRPPPTENAEGSRGGATYGGTRYANYRFDRSPRPHSAPLPYARRYVPFAPAEHGSIEGVVLWPHPPRAPERLRAARSTPADRAGSCAAAPPNQTLSVTGGGGVAGVVVYLEDVATGRMLLGRANASYPNPTKHMQTGGVLEWRGCRFHPQVQVVAPIGSVLSLTTADEPIRVSASRVDGRGRVAQWSVALGARGSAHEHLLEREGIYELRADAAGRSASAWVIVAPHPYYARTDEHGRFALDEIPPGSYTLVVWHEPVVAGFTRSGDPVLHTPPPVRRRVVVRARQGQRIVVKLQPAR